jgi:hypothetical protein
MPINKKMSREQIIHDFVHSDNPRFSGKSKKERIKMALGAWYGMHKEENLDEVKLIHSSGKVLKVGDKVKDFRGDEVEITGWSDERMKYNPGSTGRVHLKDKNGREGEYFPSVIDAKLKEEILMEGTMSTDARELKVFADNDHRLHNTSHKPIVANLEKKHEKGVYDHEKAKKLWRYHADRAAQEYHRRFGSGGKWHHMFPTSVRREAASAWADEHRPDQQNEEALQEISSMADIKASWANDKKRLGLKEDQWDKLREESWETMQESRSKKYTINDNERSLWIDNDEGLYNWHRRSRQSKRDFIRANKAEIDKHIHSVVGRKPANEETEMSEKPDNSLELLDAIVDKNALGVKNAFDAAIKDILPDMIEDEKAAVAMGMFPTEYDEEEAETDADPSTQNDGEEISFDDLDVDEFIDSLSDEELGELVDAVSEMEGSEEVEEVKD